MNRRIAIVGSIGVCGLGLSAQRERAPIVKHVGEKEVNVLMLDPLSFEKTAQLLEIGAKHGIKVNLFTQADAKDYIFDEEASLVASRTAELKNYVIKHETLAVNDFSYRGFDRQQMTKREQRNRQRKHNY